MTKRKRRYFSPDEKVSILRRHFIDNIAVSDICDQFSIKPVLFYRWQKQFFENGALAFRNSEEQRVRELERELSKVSEKLTKKHEVLSELMEEHLNLKKSLGED